MINTCKSKYQLRKRRVKGREGENFSVDMSVSTTFSKLRLMRSGVVRGEIWLALGLSNRGVGSE